MSIAVHGFSDGEASALALARTLDVPFGLVKTHEFPDGEVLPTVPEPASTVIVLRSLDRPNAKLVELVLAAEAWRRLGVRRLVLVAPYLAYMRQDATFHAGQAVSQRAVAALLGQHFDRIVTVNAHLHRTPDIAELFPDTPAQNLSAAGPIADWLAAAAWLGPEGLIIGPDEESLPLVQAVAGRLGLPFHVFAKLRTDDRTVELKLATPDGLHGRPAVILDDICSTGATLIAAIRRARSEGATDVRVAVVHALFDETTLARLRVAGASQIASTDSVRHPTNAIALNGLLAEALASEVDR